MSESGNSSSSSSSSSSDRPRRRPSPHSSMAVAFGRNYFYALGSVDAQLNCIKWEDPPFLEGSSSSSSKEESIVQVDASAQSTVFLTSSGKVYQTGTLHGHVHPVPSRISIPLPMPAIQISCGRHYCLALMQGGVVVSWGAGHFGQLGIGASADGGGLDHPHPSATSQAASLTFTSRPVIIERLLPHIIGSSVAKVAAGDWHALALTTSGRVWAWGSNRNFQCGRKPSTHSASSAPTLTAPLPVPLEAGAVVDIAAGRSHSLALVAVQQQQQQQQQSSSPSSSPSTTQKPQHEQSTQVYAWGASHHGQCGIVRRSGNGGGVVPPRLVEGLGGPAGGVVESYPSAAAAAAASGGIVAIKQIAAAGNHSLALTKGGRVFAWGSGIEGELGLGLLAVPAQVTPRLVGDLDFVAIEAGQEWKSQQIKIQQQQQQQQQIANTTTESTEINQVTPASSTPEYSTLLADVPKINQIFCGPSYSAAISSSGHVYVWGSNDAGQLGLPTPESLPMKDAFINSGGGSSKTSTSRELHVQTFDSKHNVLLPTRLDDPAVRQIFVRQVACGPNHMWVVGTERTPEQQDMVVGRTLYEVQEDQRLHKLHRARDSLLSKLHLKLSASPLEDGATTEGTTTQTDDNDEFTTTQDNYCGSNATTSATATTNLDASGGGAAATTTTTDTTSTTTMASKPPPAPTPQMSAPPETSATSATYDSPIAHPRHEHRTTTATAFATLTGTSGVGTPSTAASDLATTPASFAPSESTTTDWDDTTTNNDNSNSPAATLYDFSSSPLVPIPPSAAAGASSPSASSQLFLSTPRRARGSGHHQRDLHSTTTTTTTSSNRKQRRFSLPRMWRRFSWGGGNSNREETVATAGAYNTPGTPDAILQQEQQQQEQQEQQQQQQQEQQQQTASFTTTFASSSMTSTPTNPTTPAPPTRTPSGGLRRRRDKRFSL